MESILPLRALVLEARTYDHRAAREAAGRAAEIFLKQHLYLRQADDTPIRRKFTLLHYPLYWYYDFLYGLKVMAECSYISNERCHPALDLLVDERLPGGGWPAEKRYHKHELEPKHGNDYLDWGGAGKRRMNTWASADALYVLRTATIA
ncbi:MAG: hypothetical protein QF921_03305 [Pseudomonadales bacterium]|jgi:hypothetical protein|nr:hypothetical protein [Acidiferrobacteraceae bacterium]MDP6375429.1 hypothetical protein [Pseudomonadales bacterium]MDP6470665.1 hypothetical protein [Pseudomonadales bacterium]MDP6828478.1 hypothetical protein [Pseudomonadales bacterium]MDP6970536.1 hypothetical protein [Pseudomonadales bacterium]|tara:strand:- start:2048 stop:2494 length:447 start_codon:yes stop_codon:yes gene_type:complete